MNSTAAPTAEMARKHIFSKQEVSRYVTMGAMEEAATFGLKYGDFLFFIILCPNPASKYWLVPVVRNYFVE